MKKGQQVLWTGIVVCAMLVGLTACSPTYGVWRLVRWDTVEVYVINFKAEPVTVELEGSDGIRTITVDPFGQERE